MSEIEQDTPTTETVAALDNLMRPALTVVDGTVDLDRYGLTEMEVARHFIRRHGAEQKWCGDHKTWYVWTGTRWAQDHESQATTAIDDFVRLSGLKTGNAKAFGKNGFCVGVEGQLRRHTTMTVSAERFDRDPMLLCTPEGTVDLRTGELRQSARGDWSTKSTSVAPVKTRAPTWERFLDDATCGDADLRAYLQRVAGYWLTGLVREHALFYFYGKGGNGKGVFLDTMARILAEYRVIAPDSLVTAQKVERHETEIAALCGARLAVSEETKGVFSAEKVRKLTGGNQLSGRFMRGNFFYFNPSHKLVQAGNTRPKLYVVNDAERRRIQMIPFEHKAKEDPRLGEKLKAEDGAILQWAIDGCLEWQRIGLAPPERVLASTADYLDGEDQLGEFIGATFDLGDEKLFVASSDVFARWTEFAAARGERAGTMADIIGKLEDAGFKRGKDDTKTKRGLKGLALKAGLPPLREKAKW